MHVLPPFLHSICMLLLFHISCHSLIFSWTYSVMKMKCNIVYAQNSNSLVIGSSGHSVKEIVQFFNKVEHWENKWLKRVCFEDKPRSRWPSVLNIIVLENQLRRQSTNGIIQLGRLSRIFSRKVLKFQAWWCGDSWLEKDGRLSSERKILLLSEK